MLSSSSSRFVRSHLKTRHLVLLVELARCESVITAAAAANMTQPAASKLLAELEHGLGVQLFERLPRGVRPTPYGHVLIRRAGAALAEMDAGYREVAELAAGLRGRVAVGSILTPSVALLPRAVALLAQRVPGVRAVVTVDASRALVEGLRAGDLDIVIGRAPEMDHVNELRFEPVGDERHVVVCGPGHPLARCAAPTLPELAQEAWIVPPEGSLLRERLGAVFIAQGVRPPRESVATAELPLALSLLRRNRFLAALPLELVRTMVEEGALAVLPYDLKLSMDLYGIVTRRARQLSPAGQAMLAALREAAGAVAARPA
jgi:DNA-binding transcriptional LysR family regulator